jgi:2-succinyl-5-enolpyruvyl-6-hydroxy-3-cyclohexene-1-carboxylate synthase
LAIQQLAQQQDWPVISDVTSGLHFGPEVAGVVRHVDALVSASGFSERLRPKHVLQFGTRFLSKSLLQALSAEPPESWVVVTPREGRFDPAHRVTHRVRADIDCFCLAWHRESMVPVRPEWRQAWLEGEARVESVYAEHLDHAETLTEPGVARAVTRLIPQLHGLVLGASMPVRDVNQVSYPSTHRVHVTANRGASGIDGTFATSVGFAKGLMQPVTVLLGDLSALHDLNSLSLISKSPVPVIVVIVNNDGGGIFHFLPMADDSAEFEECFGTPHGWNFGQAAGMFSLPYIHVTNLEGFVDAYRAALTSRQSRIIEVSTDRRLNVEQHRALSAVLDLPA